MEKYCYFNGKIIEADKASLPLDDIGIIRGIAVFDYFRTYNGKPFRLQDYYKRFTNSAQKIGLKVPISQTQLSEITTKLMKKNKVTDCAFRLILTGGKSTDHISIQGNENFYILVEELPKMQSKFYKNGGSLITHEYQRQFPEAKTSFYIEASKMQKPQKKAGAQEILYYSGGKILECSKSNFFLVKNGRVITAKDSILPGITRKSAIEIAKSLKIPVAERVVRLSEIAKADEAFITSSGGAKVLPITKIDGKKVGNGKVGPITQAIVETFEEMTNL
jgi:branched-chain amino acid aminotransferase